MMSGRDFADLGVSRDRVRWKIDKWFWRDWSQQWTDTRDKNSGNATTVEDGNCN
jgi:hypothetical protein